MGRRGRRCSRIMKLVYSAESVVQVAHMRNLLECAGIRCAVRNYHLTSAIGEIPFAECWPQLWAVEEYDTARAEKLLSAEVAGVHTQGSAWTCPTCREAIEAQFTACWRCGCERLPSPSPASGRGSG